MAVRVHEAPCRPATADGQSRANDENKSTQSPRDDVTAVRHE